MRTLKWWFRTVGGFYVLLTVMNLWFLIVDEGQAIADTLPPPLNENAEAVRAFGDAWLVFVLELGVLGMMMLVGARDPIRNRILAVTVIWAEVFRGIVADGIWITRGYSPAAYAGFIALHAVIITSGLILLRRAEPDRLVEAQ